MKRKKEAYVYPKLKGIRNEYGYSIDDMARMLGISTNCYFRKEKGKTDFYLCEVRKILDLFNVEFNEIFFTPIVNEKVDDKTYVR